MTQKKTQIQNTVQQLKGLKSELTLRLGLLFQNRITSKNQLEGLTTLSKLNRELKLAYQKIHQQPLDGDAEKCELEKIRILEDQRFQLLNQINGSNLANYNTLPLEVE